jgi:DEAD/DEAH box helicase domain-containing protein
MYDGKTVVFFDLETKKLFQEVGGRGNERQLGMSAAVTYNTSDGEFHRYREEDAGKLVEELRNADLVVGFNVVRFDYAVLQAYTDFQLRSIPTLDMLEDIYRKLGFMVKLDALAHATLGVGKSADGVLAVQWYRQGLIDKVLDYCQQDVEVTRQLYEYGKKFKHLKYKDRYGRLKLVPVSW